MKKFALALLAMIVVGCSNTQSFNASDVNWQQDNLAALADTTLQLKSSLWTDHMPKVGESDQSQALNGTLTLETSGELPAELVVKLVVIKQDAQSWPIPGDETELRTQSENRWEVVFHSELDIDIEKGVDVALELNDANGYVWLVERNVQIDKVY